MGKLGGVSHNTQNRYEGGTPPPIDYLLRIGDAGADWYWIVTGRRLAGELIEDDAAELLGIFRALPALFKGIALDQIRALAGHAATNLDLVAAGTGLAETHGSPKIHDAKRNYRSG